MFLTVRNYYFICFLIFLSWHACGQNAIRYPTNISQFFNYYSLLNPAATGTDQKFLLRAGEQFHAGNYSRIRYFFANAEYALNLKDKEGGHSLGISFADNREGLLLSLNRFYLQYAYRLALSEKWKISGGISAGVVNFSAEQTVTSGKVSSFTADGGFGLFLYSENEKIGISSSQIFNRYLRVINEEIAVRRFYRVLYSRTLPLSSQVKLIPALNVAFNSEISEIDLNTSVLLKDLIFAGISYRYKRGSAYFFGIRDLVFMGGISDFTFSYNAPWPGAGFRNIQTFELIMAYKIY